MSITEKLQIIITADGKAAQREFDKVGRSAERSLGTTEDRLKQASGQLVSFGSTAVVAGGVAAAGLFQLARAAGDLGEAQNKANVILGTEGAAALSKFADSAADTAGVSKRAALDAGAGFGLFVEKAGFAGEAAGQVSADLVQLAGDISSIQNVSTDEALTALTSALAGESEAVRRLGIDISDATLKQAIYERTGQKVTGTLSQQAKTTEILNQLFQQGAVFAGDFSNTSDSLANRQKNLAAEFENTKAAIGEALLPAFETLLGGLQGVTQGFGELPAGTQKAIGGFAGIAVASTIAVGGLALLAGGGMRVVDTLGNLKSRMADTSAFSRMNGAVRDSTGALGTLQGTARGLTFAAGIAGAGVFATQLYGLRISSEQLQSTLDQLKLNIDSSDVSTAALALEEYGRARLSLIDTVTQPIGEDIVDGAGEVVTNLKVVETALENLYKARDETNLRATIDLLENLVSLPGNEGIGPQLQTEIGIAERSLDNLVSAREKDADAADAGAAATGRDADAKDEAADGADALKSALSRLVAQQKMSNLAFDIGAERAKSFTDAIGRSTDVDDVLKSAIGAGRALLTLRNNYEEVKPAADKATGANEAARKVIDALGEAASSADPTLSRLGITMGASEAAAAAFADSLDNAGGFGRRLGSALSVGDAFDDFSKSARRLPEDLDLAAISLGELTPRTAEAVREILALGGATSEYLTTLLRTGSSTDDVRAEAERLRNAFAEQLSQLGLNAEQLAEYIKLTGTAPEDVETAIRLSGLEASRFKLNAYLGLLEGKIPPEVATQVIAQINADDLNGAAGTLERFASTNPVTIDVSPTGTAQLEEAGKLILELPAKYDAVKAATGQYTEEQYKGLEAVLSLGDAAKEYLATLVSSDPERARSEAARLREEYGKTLTQLGVNSDELGSYYELLGIAPTQVDTAISISIADAELFALTTTIALLQDLDGLSPEVQLQLSDALLRGDYEEVRLLLQQRVDAELGVNTEPALTGLELLRATIPMFGESVPVGSDIGEAISGLERLRNEVPLFGESVPVDANDSPARTDLSNLQAVIPQFGGQVTVGANVQPALSALATLSAMIPIFGVTGRAGLNPGATRQIGGLDGDTRTPFAMGGLVRGPGTGTSDDISAVLSNGEYVIKAAAVDKVGVKTLDAINAGTAMGFGSVNVATSPTAPADNNRELVAELRAIRSEVAAQRQQTGGDVIHITESISGRETAEDVLRVKRSNRFLVGA